MRRLLRNTFILATCLVGISNVNADVTLATWTTGIGAATKTATGSLTVPNAFSTTLTLTTPNQGTNPGQVFNTNWNKGWSGLSTLGTISPTTNDSIAVGYSNSVTAQTIRSTVALDKFYMFFDYVDSGTYNFSNWSGSVTQISKNVATGGGSITLSGKTVTVSNIASGSLGDGFVLYFSGATLPSNTDFTFNITSAAGAETSGFSFSAVPEPGTLLLGGIAAACGGGGVWWKRRRKEPAKANGQAEAGEEAGAGVTG